MTDVIPGGIMLDCSATARCNPTLLRTVTAYMTTLSDLGLLILSISLICCVLGS